MTPNSSERTHYRGSDKHQEILTKIIREQNLAIVVGRRSTEYRDGTMCCGARTEAPTLTYGERKDFMDDEFTHLQATISAKFSTRMDPAKRRARQLKIAAYICKLGGTVMLNGTVTRVQANEMNLFITIITALRKETEKSELFFPVRTDICSFVF